MSKKLALNYLLKNATDLQSYRGDPSQLDIVLAYIESLKNRTPNMTPHQLERVKSELHMLMGELQNVINVYSYDHGTSAESDRTTLTEYETNLILHHKSLEAIKSVRMRLNIGLQEAKDFVESQSLKIFALLPAELSRVRQAYTVPQMNAEIARICSRTGETKEIVFSRLSDLSKKYNLNLNLT